MSEIPDSLHTFLLQRSGVRGVIVHLDAAWSEICARSDYPPAVGRRLGESLAASALFAGILKFEGSLSIHLRNAGALQLLSAECTDDGYLRGIARFDDTFTAGSVDLRDPRAQLAITIENAHTKTRYQGLVPVESENMAKAFEGYFERSEQLPTRIVLAEREGRCAGIMLQMIAESAEASMPSDSDGWNRVGHLLATLTEDELLDLPVQNLLLRLFHEEDVLLQQARPLAFRCSCSRQRVCDMLCALGYEQAETVLSEDGTMDVDCEFCGRSFSFDRSEISNLFQQTEAASSKDAPRRSSDAQ